MSNQPPKNHRPVTQRDIARECGVHVSTVSLALRNDPQIPVETINRIREAAKRLGYDPSYNAAARRLVLRNYGKDVANNAIAVLFPPNFIDATFFARMYAGIISELSQIGYSVYTSFLDIHTTDESHYTFAPAIRRGEVDGLIAFGHDRVLPRLLKYLRSTAGFGNRPIAIVNAHIAGYFSILADQYQGGYVATKHLLELGHTDILLMLFTGTPDGPRARLLGAQQAMREAGIDPDIHLSVRTTPSIWLSSTTPLFGTPAQAPPYDDTASIAEFLEFFIGHPEITGIIAVNDPSARQLYQLCMQNGRPIPQDISLIGFDDTDPIINIEQRNILTSVRMPLVEMGRQACQVILDRINGKLATDGQRVTLPVELIVRESTGPRA